jgi:centrosomal protein CEP57
LSSSELETQLNSYESRCNLLEKQLEYMRKLVTNAERDKQEILQRQYMKNRHHSAATENEIKEHMDKISDLEREQLKLTATQTVAQVGCGCEAIRVSWFTGLYTS